MKAELDVKLSTLVELGYLKGDYPDIRLSEVVGGVNYRRKLQNWLCEKDHRHVYDYFKDYFEFPIWEEYRLFFDAFDFLLV